VTKLKCVDAFCGAGGLGLGLKRAGFDILLSFDIDNQCIETISKNKKYFGHKAKQADIADMLNGALLKKCGIKRGELDLLAGGPPCQGFSIQRIGEDKDIRNQLVLKYEKLIEELYPKCFLMENVSGIAGKRGKTILHQLISSAEKMGYVVSLKMLNAQNYGVPQRRKRCFIVGVRRELGVKFEYPQTSKIVQTVRDTIGNLPVPLEDGTDHPKISFHRRDKLSKKNLERIKAITEGQGRDALPKKLLAKCHHVSSSVIGHRNVYGRMAWDDVAPTITARFDSFTRGQFGHPYQPRTISLREGALLQTFPKDFIFTGNKVDVARQIGNAVPPVLAKKVGQSIIKCLTKKWC